MKLSTAELLSLELDVLPKTQQGIDKKAKLEDWQFERIAARGRNGSLKYYFIASMPTHLQLAILEKKKEAVLASALPLMLPEPLEDVSGSNEKQRTQCFARQAVLNAIEKLIEETQASQDDAITTFLISAQHPSQAHLARMLQLACDTRGGGTDTPSKRTIYRWLKARQNGTLLKRTAPKTALPEWFYRFLSFYQTPQKPSVQAAFDCFLNEERKRNEDLPSVHQARRLLNKMGNVSREKGRVLERELKTLKPYTVREFKHLHIADIFTADGHTFDAEILHPDSGKPFRPEITTVADVATRKIVGWSVDLAESAHAVLDALVFAVKTHGIPAVFYVDNGKGYKNALMSDQAVGLMGRLGITMTHSLPYGSQARGVIERLHQTVWVQAAKTLQSYMGKDMDAQARQWVHKQSRALMKDEALLKNAPALSQIASLNPHLIPDFEAFKKIAYEAVESYNNHPHRALPKVRDISGKTRHMTPNELWALKEAQGESVHKVSKEESLYLFLPQVLRTVQRGQVSLWKNVYFSHDLTEFNGDVLRVAYDIHNAERVWLFDDSGCFVCAADWNANKVDYMPQSMIEMAKEKRIENQIKRLKTRQSILEAARPNRVIEHEKVSLGGLVLDMNAVQKEAERALFKIHQSQDDSAFFRQPEKTEKPETFRQPERFTVPDTKEERYTLYCDLKKRAFLSEQEAKWLTRYEKTSECSGFEKTKQAYA